MLSTRWGAGCALGTALVSVACTLGGPLREWYDPEHGIEIYLIHDGTGKGSLETEELKVRYSLAWTTDDGRFEIEFYCREVGDGGVCSDSRTEDFALSCDYDEGGGEDENGEDDRMTCTGPDGTYHFTPVI